MFVDLVGSTALASGRDPEELRDLIPKATRTPWLAKSPGSRAMSRSFWVTAFSRTSGWPRAHEDDAGRAVRAGLRVTEAVAVLRERGGHRWPLASASQPVWSVSAG